VFCLTVAEIQACDRRALEKKGINSLVLMENAAFEVFRFIESRFTKRDSILIVTGKGNNGGDGFAVARLLHTRGYMVTLCKLYEPQSKDARHNHRLAKRYGVPFISVKNVDFSHFAVLLDAVTGTGFKGALEPFIAALFSKMNRLDVIRIAIDMPSGVNGDNGSGSEEVFQAHHTVTFEYPKIGHYIGKGREAKGKLHICPIGIADPSDDYVHTLLSVDEFALKKPAHDVHKYSRGHVCVIGGSQQYQGAPVLTAETALRSGCGYVEIRSVSDIKPRLPEIVAQRFPDWQHLPITEPMRRGVLAIGMGASHTDDLLIFMKKLFTEFSGLKLIIDGDALYYFNDYFVPGIHTVILTPHRGEFARLINATADACKKEPLSLATDFAKRNNVTIVLKSEDTVVFAPEGRCALSPYGNPGMATLGCGDVLAGVIAGVWASQQCDAFTASTIGTALHGYAADRIYSEKGAVFSASDLILEIHGQINDRMK